MSRQRIVIPLLGTALLAAGCGLTEYESKMQEVNSRQAYLEEIDQKLGPPLTWPERIPVPKGQKPLGIVSSSEVFFRPPRGIQEKGEIKPYGPTLFRFPALAGTTDIQEMFFGVAARKKLDAYKKEVLAELQNPDVKWVPKEVKRGAGRAPLQYEGATWDDRNKTRMQLFLIYAEQGGSAYCVAVLFRLPATPDPLADARINYSLGSLAVGYAAAQQHQSYQARASAGHP